MRRFAEKSHIELYYQWKGMEMKFTVVKKVFIYLKYEQRYSTLKTGLSRKSDFGKSEKNAVKLQHLKSQKVLSNGRLRTEFR